MSSSLKDLQCIAVSKVDVSRASKTSTTHPRVGRLQSPILVQQQTNHVGRLVLLAGAPGCPTGSATGLLQWDQTDKTNQVKPPDSGHPRLTRKRQTNSETTPSPGEVKNRGRGARTGSPGAPRDSSPSHLSERYCSFATYTTSTDDIDKQT